MSKASDEREHLIANSLDSLSNVVAVRPKVGTEYSDVKVTFNGKSSWLEVKMNHSDNLANARVYYQDQSWHSNYKTPVAQSVVKELNATESVSDFVYSISDYSGIAYETIFIPTNKSKMNSLNSVPLATMKAYCNQYGSYVLDNRNYDLTDLVTLHYTTGKAEPAYYIQAGDDFLMISNANPLGLTEDIPVLEGTGKFRVRVSNRSQFYEIQTELKLTSSIESRYSVMPNSNKINPFL